MKVRLSIDRLTGNRIDITLEVERFSMADQARLASESEAGYRSALEAITAASQLEAHRIAALALGGESS